MYTGLIWFSSFCVGVRDFLPCPEQGTQHTFAILFKVFVFFGRWYNVDENSHKISSIPNPGLRYCCDIESGMVACVQFTTRAF